MATQFKDHFSGHSDSYAAHRPSYPDALFATLAQHCSSHELAWDCATGNGQAAHSVAQHFASVIATDASQQQISCAAAHDRIEYRHVPAEASGLEPASIDLITVAQALHWFDIENFFREAGRVLKDGGVLAVWSYERCSVDKDCDAAIENVFALVENFWPPERAIVENDYHDVTIPWKSLELGAFSMKVEWKARDMLNYMETWSASRRYLRANGISPVDTQAAQLLDCWGSRSRTVTWPINLKASKK